ncbi:hypothetical protein Lal_00018165 [Lupinus albus]|uniref:RING-type E3 ubiquitin transferase n=1 Tax=Lupinus albus TaxID=3870 RepID=A0A6A5M586_LUPAL|nr:hypothetical protein Lalb_Chr25g0286401 [Lupinus albus]KAF1866780.1 hypothetical protein Lal_00018165 [Lupinus albus]
MVMDSFHSSMLFFLITFLSFNHVFSYSSRPSYNDHCASLVPKSTPTEFTSKSFPLGAQNTGYFTGGDRIIDVDTTMKHYFRFQMMQIYATHIHGLFSIVGTASFIRTNIFSYQVGNFSYGARSSNWRKRGNRRGLVTFNLVGFWSETSGKVCMVGTSKSYSKTGNYVNLDAVFKLKNVYNASNISSLVSGSLESLSSRKDENYFEPFSILMFPKTNYKYTLDSIEAENDFSSETDTEKGLSLNMNSSSFCSSYPLSRVITRLWLEYSNECISSKNCSPISESYGQLPSLLSLKGIECSATKKYRLRVLMEFVNGSYSQINQGFNPKNMLVGEGWWDEKKNRLCVVACNMIGMETSLDGIHVGDCSIRLRLRLPSILSLKNSSSIEGQIWTNKTVADPGYFKRITFRTDEVLGVGSQGLKYKYSQIERVKQSCPANKPVKNQGSTRYPDAYSYNMRFDMSVRESYRRVAWGYSTPLSVGDHFYDSNSGRNLEPLQSSKTEVSNVIVNNDSLFNISYKIGISLRSNSTLSNRNSLFYLSSETVKISAEGIYNAGTGTLCMVGCRDLPSNRGEPITHSVDCEVLVKFQIPSLDAKNGSYIKGSIESMREKSDPLYFKRLDLSSAAFFTEAAKEAVWRMDMEVIMVLISTTLACVFVGLQLYHVKKHPNVLPLTSIIMMSILTLGHMIPLVLNFEALLTQNPNKNIALENVGWLEVNEISVRLITMVAFLLQFRLLQMTWSSRKSDEGKKGLWDAEKKAAYVTLPWYAAGLLIALLLKLKINADKVPMLITVYFKSYGGLVLDGFLLPQIILNMFSNMKENVLSCAFFFGTTFVRLLPHAYDLYRTHNYADIIDNESYVYAVPSADFYSTAWDIVIPLGGILFAIIIYLQQCYGSHFVPLRRFKGSNVYEKVAEVETINLNVAH